MENVEAGVSGETVKFSLDSFSLVAFVTQADSGGYIPLTEETQPGLDYTYRDVLGNAVNYGITVEKLTINNHMDTTFAAIFIISINTGAYMAEIIRGGIVSVDKGQFEAAHAIGMTHWQTMVNVVLPQAIRNILPSVGNEFIVNIKDSSVLNVISVTELFFQAKSAAGTYYRYFEVYFIIAVIYLILTLSVSKILALIERKMDGPDNYVIHGSQSDSHAAIRVNKENEEASKPWQA